MKIIGRNRVSAEEGARLRLSIQRMLAGIPEQILAWNPVVWRELISIVDQELNTLRDFCSRRNALAVVLL